MTGVKQTVEQGSVPQHTVYAASNCYELALISK